MLKKPGNTETHQTYHIWKSRGKHFCLSPTSPGRFADVRQIRVIVVGRNIRGQGIFNAAFQKPSPLPKRHQLGCLFHDIAYRPSFCKDIASHLKISPRAILTVLSSNDIMFYSKKKSQGAATYDSSPSTTLCLNSCLLAGNLHVFSLLIAVFSFFPIVPPFSGVFSRQSSFHFGVVLRCVCAHSAR